MRYGAGSLILAGTAVRRGGNHWRDGTDPDPVVTEAERRHHQRHAQGALIAGALPGAVLDDCR